MSTGLSSRSSCSLSADDIFDLLSDQRRRTVLDILRARDDPLALADVAREVVRDEDTPIDAVPAEDLERVHSRLYHQDVPKLADYGVVEYNVERRTVALTEQARQLALLWELMATVG